MNPIVEAQMLIRQPIARVFQAFVDPAITTKFWFTISTGKLKESEKYTWNGKCMVYQKTYS
ncbi:hypothetical protein [Membranihabitans maritimus]|uniref:hypothetical protein n=1 Tax=Membranihabitans maritimus TaxID=2904244 RepID=UPI001F1857BC|nr:hypothetical protein [Membranihabitans maritimus]